MQIFLKWSCRECGSDRTIGTDSSRYGTITVNDSVDQPQIVALRCGCGHVSAELALGYRHLPEHRPSWESERPEFPVYFDAQGNEHAEF